MDDLSKYGTVDLGQYGSIQAAPPANNVAGSQIAGNTYGGAFGQSNNLLQGLGIQANALTGQGNAAAAGTVGGTNALTGGINGAITPN